MIRRAGLDSRRPACFKRHMLRRILLLTVPFLLTACAREAPPPRPGATVAQVRIEARSALPPPATSTYADALYTARVEVMGSTGHPPLRERRISLLFPGFTKRVLHPESAYAVGDLVEVECIPLDQASREQQMIQQADELGDVELTVHLSLRSRKIKEVTLAAPVAAPAAPPAKGASTLERNEFRVTVKEEAARAATMAAEAAELERLAAERGGWDAWWEATQKLREELKFKVTAAGGVLTRGRLSLSDLSILDARFNPGSGNTNRMIQSLTQLRDIFAEGGTHFILAPFPDRTLVAAPHFLDYPPGDGVVQPEVLRMRHALLGAGIEMIDATAATRAELSGEDFLFFYDSPDPHPAEGAVRALAGVVSERLARYELPRAGGDLRILHKPYRGPVPFGGGVERAAKRADMILDETDKPLRLDAAGPVLFMGDSFLESPAGYGPSSTGLAYQVAKITGLRPGLFERKSGAFHMIRYAVRQPKTVFPDRKIAIFVTSTANLLLHAGEWALIDLEYEKARQRIAASEFPAALPLSSWTAENRFEGLTGEPSDGWRTRTDGAQVVLGTVPVTLRLRLPLESTGRTCMLHCTIKSSGYADAVVRSGSSKAGLEVLKGESRLIVVFVSNGEEARIEFPPGRGEVVLRALDLRMTPAE